MILLTLALLAATPPVSLAVGDAWVLRLPCHGYPCRWEAFDVDARVLARDRLPEWEGTGEAAVQVYRFRAASPGKTRVRVLHGGSRAVETRVYTVDVVEDW